MIHLERQLDTLKLALSLLEYIYRDNDLDALHYEDEALQDAYPHYHARYNNDTYRAYRRALEALGIMEYAIIDRCNDLTDAALECSLRATGGYHRRYAGAIDRLYAAIAAMPTDVRDAANAHLRRFQP